MEKIYIYSISDSVGETSESLIKAALCQFNYNNYEIKKYSFVSTLDELKNILEESKTHKSIFFYTLVETELVNYIKEFSRNYEIKNVDLLSEALNSIAGVLNMEPKREPGILRRLNMSYFDRIEAVEFAVKYDDGKNTSDLDEADIILIGVSRTSKTPISIYLANKNYKVANIPLMPEVEPPRELFEISNNKIFGLILDPNHLVNIRSERIRAMGLTGTSNYGSYERVMLELEKAQQLFDKLGCTVIDVTSKAIEEIAAIILANIMRR